MSIQSNTGTAKTVAPENGPKKKEQNPGTSREQKQDPTGTKEERGQNDSQNDVLSADAVDENVVETSENADTSASSTIRNPSGDDLSGAIEGSPRRI